MNTLEKQMVGILKQLKKDFNVVAIKAEFEAEGTRLDEAIRLKVIVDNTGLGLILKTGGAEAIRDMFDAQLLGVTGLMAPMIESSYALRKYLEAIETYFPAELKKEISFGINIETIQAYNNLKEIFATKGIKKLSTITVGRVDFVGSLGMGRDEVNNDRIYQIAEDICRRAKKLGLRTTLGGGIAVEALPFIKKLVADRLLNRYETRKIVFAVPKSFQKAGEGIILANEFELLWLKNKKNYYATIYTEDDKRIEMLNKRLKAKKFGKPFKH